MLASVVPAWVRNASVKSSPPRPIYQDNHGHQVCSYDSQSKEERLEGPELRASVRRVKNEDDGEDDVRQQMPTHRVSLLAAVRT
jgi:hypothetical protein